MEGRSGLVGALNACNVKLELFAGLCMGVAKLCYNSGIDSLTGENIMYIIWKTTKINNRNLRYWSDDGGLSWYWIGSRKP